MMLSMEALMPAAAFLVATTKEMFGVALAAGSEFSCVCRHCSFAMIEFEHACRYICGGQKLRCNGAKGGQQALLQRAETSHPKVPVTEANGPRQSQ